MFNLEAYNTDCLELVEGLMKHNHACLAGDWTAWAAGTLESEHRAVKVIFDRVKDRTRAKADELSQDADPAGQAWLTSQVEGIEAIMTSLENMAHRRVEQNAQKNSFIPEQMYYSLTWSGKQIVALHRAHKQEVLAWVQHARD